MAFIRTVPLAEATGDVQAMYQQTRESLGYVPNYVTAFSLRPEIWNGFVSITESILRNMDSRRYELVIVGVALALECSYCALSHGQVLRDQHLGVEGTEAFARDFQSSSITPAEKAMVAFVQKIARRSSAITQEDVDVLRGHGFADEEIFDIISAATARCLMSKLLDAVGAEPDALYADLEPSLRQALTVGRAIEQRA